MYSAGQHPLYPYSMEEKQEILVESGLNEKQLQADIDNILKWYQKQPHLPEDKINRHMIELTIITAKGSLEKVKQRIDCYFKYRYLAPELVQSRIELLKDPNYSLWSSFLQAPMPKLYKGKRITVTLFTDPDSSSLNTQNVLLGSLMTADIRYVNDYMIGDIWIVDVNNCSLGHVMKMNPVMIHKAAKIVQDGTGLRIFGIHVVNCSTVTVMQFILNLLKQILSQKLFGRIKFHHNLESLYEEVPKEYLPIDYGGDLKSIAAITDEYEKLVKSKKTTQFLIDACNQISDESKRPKDDHNEEYLAGTFKKLDLD